jgi:quinoprotein glucose dehydrogenase
MFHRRWLGVCLTMAAGLLLAAIPGRLGMAQSSSNRWWTGYGNGPDNSRYFDSLEIDRSNVGRLEVAWTYPWGDTESSPVVVDGVIYGRGRSGSLVAVDAETGAELWIREDMNGMTRRGMNYWESADGADRRLIFAMDSLLQQVDAGTGRSIESFGTNGAVDLRIGIDGRDPADIRNIQSSIPGEVFENLIILGSATGEGYMSPPGDIRAYDVVTGDLVWTFHTVPRPGEFGYDTWPPEAWQYVGGTNNWGEMTVDTDLGIAYIPLGSPTYDFYGADRTGSNLFGTSIVALDARTGERIWHFQLVHHDLWDLDPNAAPQLTTIRHEGVSRDVVAVAGKTGWLYVFDRRTGEPIWPIEERPVPQSTMPGEESWPTQPFPTGPPPFIRQTFGVDDLSPHVPDAEDFRERLAAADNQGIFTPISFDDTVHVPTSNGGALFGGAAAAPEGAVYVVAHDNPGVLRLLRPGENVGRGGASMPPGQVVYQRECQSCHGADRSGSETAPALIWTTPDPENGVVAGAPRFEALAISGAVRNGQGRMPPFPHLDDADVDGLIAFLTASAGGRGRGGFGGRGGAPEPPAPPELVVGSGSVVVRPDAGGRGRGAAAPYPEGLPDWERYVINEYHTVGDLIAPPFTSIVKYDLNEPGIEWSIGFGDDPELALQGVTGTGVPGLLNGIVVTASGIVFGAGGDNRIRAWSSDDARELWSSEFGGTFVGSPVMYEMNGRAYLLVPASGRAPGISTGGPLGWVAYSLPE